MPANTTETGQFDKGQSGNPSGRPKAVYTDALRRIVDPDELARVAWNLAQSGDGRAIADIYARLEGKPVATVTLDGSEDRPLHDRRSERAWEPSDIADRVLLDSADSPRP